MRRHMYGVVALLVAALALTGCGGTGEDGTPAAGSSAPASLDPHTKGVKFAQCMRENGIQVDDPEPGKGVRMLVQGVSQEQVQKAMEACREWAPEGATGAKADPAQAEQMRKYAQCMRDNGVEAFPDQEGTGIRIDKSVADDPDFEAADKKCGAEFRPGAGR